MVTAAGNGIGRATAKMFACEGAKVIATDIDDSALSDIPDVIPRRLDVTDPEAIQRFSAETGSIDVLFNCAGFVHCWNNSRVYGARLGFFFQPERSVHVPPHPGVSTRHARAWRRVDHQYVFRGLERERGAEPVCSTA